MDKFEVLRLIGEGGYGVVYKCRSKDTSDIVAIKKIKHNINGDPRKVGLREIRILTALKHPNINQLLGAFKSKDRLFLVLECVDKTLLDVLNESPTGIASNKFRSYTYQLACALQYCHAKGIVHRDVKPENLLVTERDDLKLCDFGFARFLPSTHNVSITSDEDNDLPGMSTGYHQLTVYVATRWYRPPELILRLPYGKPVDVWTIGCILVEMATGEPLFCGDTDIDQLFQISSAVGSFTSDQMEAMLASPKYQFITNLNAPKTSKARKDNSLERFHGLLGDEMYDILLRCINNDPNERITADACVNHPALELERRTITPQMSTFSKLTQLLSSTTKSQASGSSSSSSKRSARWDWSKMVMDLPETSETPQTTTTAAAATTTTTTTTTAAAVTTVTAISKEEAMLMDAEVDLEKERAAESEDTSSMSMSAHELVKQYREFREFGFKRLTPPSMSIGRGGGLKLPPSSKPGNQHRASTDASLFPKINSLVTAAADSPPLHLLQRSSTWFQSSSSSSSIYNSLPPSTASSISDDGKQHYLFSSSLSLSLSTSSSSSSSFKKEQQRLNNNNNSNKPNTSSYRSSETGDNNNTATATSPKCHVKTSSSSSSRANVITISNIYVPSSSSKKSCDVMKQQWDDALLQKQRYNSSNQKSTTTTASTSNPDFSTTTLQSLKNLNYLKRRQTQTNIITKTTPQDLSNNTKNITTTTSDHDVVVVVDD